MKKYLFIIVLVVPLYSFCQNFPYITGEPNSTNTGNIYAAPNGNIIIINYMWNFEYDSEYSKILLLNSEGQLLINKLFEYPILDILTYSNDSLYILYSKFNEYPNNYLYCALMYADFTFRKKDSIIINDNDCWTTKLFLHNDSLMFFSNHFNFPPTNPHLTLGKVNKDGTFSSNVKTIDINSYLVADALVTPQKEWYIFCNKNYIVKLDSNYNLIGELTFTDNDFDHDYCSFWNTDKYIITGGTTSKGSMKILKSYSNLVRRKSVNPDSEECAGRAGLFSNVAKADSFFYFVGTKGMDTLDNNYSPNNSYIFVACLDFNLRIRWEKKFGGNAFYKVFSLNCTKDNECLVLATKDTIDDDKDINMLYVLKVNQQGNIVTSTSVYKTEPETLVYPNPGTNQFNIKLPEYIQPVSITLYTISGIKVLSQTINSQQTQITTSQLPLGIYIYQIKSNNKIVGSGKWVKQ